MQIPPALRLALDACLDERPLDGLRSEGARLSQRYRAETRDGKRHLDGEAAVLAYLAARLPATFAAVRASLAGVAERQPDFAPRTLLDVGAGPGTVLWAAREAFGSLRSAALVEASPPALAVGSKLWETGPEDAGLGVEWIEADLLTGLASREAADLVSLAYVLDELPPAAIPRLVADLWRLTSGVLVIVEPGTTGGWRRILAARDQLLAAGGVILAPCPHAGPCPLAAPDWCHFAQRVERSRTHRLTKGGTVPYEDEKYIYLAVARAPADPPEARVLAPPRGGSGKVQLKLCTADAALEQRLVTRREGDAFRKARRLEWGDAWE
jgi:ribosomal protein RSM22 (predicted rRNA methylase)